MKRLPRLLTLATLASVAFPVAFAPSAAFAGSTVPNQAWLPSIPDSAALTTPTIISGIIASSAGVPFPAGTGVEVVAEPSNEVLSSTAIGDSIQDTPVAKGHVGTNGAFAIRLPANASLARFASANFVNLELRAISGGSLALFAFPHLLRDSTSAAGATANASAAPAALTSELVELRAQPPTAAVSAAQAALSGVVDKTDVCGSTKIASYAGIPVELAGVYTAASGTTGEFDYKASSTSELGLAISVSGKAGTYSQSGTHAVTTSSSWDFGIQTGAHTDWTHFTYTKYSLYCYPVGSSYSPGAIYSYETIPTSLDGGEYIYAATAPSAPPAANCGPLAASGHVTISSTTASTWSSGVSISGVGGLTVNLSSRTGYSTSSSITYRNNTTTTKHVCGVSGPPGSHPGRLVTEP